VAHQVHPVQVAHQVLVVLLYIRFKRFFRYIR
jgi:hypothetical protein